MYESVSTSAAVMRILESEAENSDESIQMKIKISEHLLLYSIRIYSIHNYMKQSCLQIYSTEVFSAGPGSNQRGFSLELTLRIGDGRIRALFSYTAVDFEEQESAVRTLQALYSFPFSSSDHYVCI
jgi:hypothetical protein